jgi:hypothetical protein
VISRFIARLRGAAPDDEGDARIRREGYPGRGTVVSVRETGRADGVRREVELALDVYLGRSRTFRAELRPWVTASELEQLQLGRAVPVAADHAEPGHVVLAFDMDEPVSIAGLGPVAGGPGGPRPGVGPVSRSPDEPEGDR